MPKQTSKELKGSNYGKNCSGEPMGCHLCHNCQFHELCEGCLEALSDAGEMEFRCDEPNCGFNVQQCTGCETYNNDCEKCAFCHKHVCEDKNGECEWVCEGCGKVGCIGDGYGPRQENGTWKMTGGCIDTWILCPCLYHGARQGNIYCGETCYQKHITNGHHKMPDPDNVVKKYLGIK